MTNKIYIMHFTKWYYLLKVKLSAVKHSMITKPMDQAHEERIQNTEAQFEEATLYCHCYNTNQH